MLRALSEAPSGCAIYCLGPKKLCRFSKKHARDMPRLAQRARALCRSGEETDVKKACKQIYNSPKNWIMRFDASVAARCPGSS
eukprot:213961-Pyramimonas_sp.AAC.1